MKVSAKFVLAFLAVAALAGAADAAAQVAPATAGTRIGYVNVGIALRAMPGWAQAESTFVKEREAAEAELRRMQTALDSAGTAFQQQSAMLSASNRTARQRELAQQEQALNERAQALQTQLGERQEELLSPLQERLTAIIDGLRAEGNFAVIFDIGGQAGALIVSYDRSLDITPQVLRRVQQAPGN